MPFKIEKTTKESCLILMHFVSIALHTSRVRRHVSLINKWFYLNDMTLKSTMICLTVKLYLLLLFIYIYSFSTFGLFQTYFQKYSVVSAGKLVYYITYARSELILEKHPYVHNKPPFNCYFKHASLR